MEKVAPNSKFVGHSTEIIRQSKIKGPLAVLIPVVVLQNVNIKSCVVCVKSDKYAFLVTIRPLGRGRGMRRSRVAYITYNIRREEAKLSILKLASVFHHLSSVGPKQLCALAHLG